MVATCVAAGLGRTGLAVVWQDRGVAPRDAVEPQADSLHHLHGSALSRGGHGEGGGPAPIPSPASRLGSAATGSAVHRVIASELQHRDQASDALAMMVTSMVSMVQAGKASRSRWSAS